MSKVYAYARVSSEDQSLDVQKKALEAADIVLAETASGASRDGRPKLAMVLEVIGRGDTLIVTKLDRLARDTVDMLEIVREIGKKGAGFRSLAESWACFEPSPVHEAGLNPMVELILTVMGGVAQFERARIKERQREGIEAAKAKGDVYKGGSTRYDAAYIRSMRAAGKMPAQIRKELGCSKATVNRALANGADA